MSDGPAERATTGNRRSNSELRAAALYYFSRLRLPGVGLSPDDFARHLRRAFALYEAKRGPAGAGWGAYLESLHGTDCLLAWACLEGNTRAWEALFAARVSRSEALLVDALRSRAVRLFPRDAERQEEAVAEGVLVDRPTVREPVHDVPAVAVGLVRVLELGEEVVGDR